jgi:hypothetical protein
VQALAAVKEIWNERWAYSGKNFVLSAIPGLMVALSIAEAASARSFARSVVETTHRKSDSVSGSI